MKHLYIVRHAKSSWDDPLADDFSRPLNDRGKRDAPNMGKRLKERKITPNLMLTSPAQRALSTCKRIAKAIGYKADNIKTDKKLYHANEDQMLEVVQSMNDKHDVVMIFGHNPGLTDFVNALGKLNYENVPTCGIAAFAFQVDTWKDVCFEKGRLLFYDYPKNKEKE